MFNVKHMTARDAAGRMPGGAYAVQLMRGEVYLVRPADAALSRYCLDWQFSGAWRLRGVRLMPIKGANWSHGEFVPIGRLLDFITRADREELWTRANGTGRVIGCDFDHGTDREWGEAIRSIQFVKGA